MDQSWNMNSYAIYIIKTHVCCTVLFRMKQIEIPWASVKNVYGKQLNNIEIRYKIFEYVTSKNDIEHDPYTSQRLKIQITENRITNARKGKHRAVRMFRNESAEFTLNGLNFVTARFDLSSIRAFD